MRQAEADDGEDLSSPSRDAARDARFLMLQTPGQVAQEPLGLVCVVLVPGLTERLLDARVQMLGQALDDVTALVDLAALDGELLVKSCVWVCPCGGAILAFSIHEFDASNDLGELI